MVVLSHLSFRMPGFKGLLDSRYVSPVKKTARFLGQAIFAKAKDKRGGAGNDRHVIKATKEISMQPLIVLAVVSMTALYMLIIAGCLCYIGARVSDVLITLRSSLMSEGHRRQAQ
jgi:hypothetical protein